MHKRLVTGFIACLMLALPAAQAQTFEMVSLTNLGQPPAFAPAGISHQAAVTPDGRYVVFEGGYTGLVTSPVVGSNIQIYLRDREHGTTELISQSTAGFAANGNDTSRPTISNDGCRVVFLSSASNLIDGITTATQHVFLRNRCGGTPTTTMVDVLPGGGPSTGQALQARLSGDGRTVALTSYSLLVAGLKLHDGLSACSGTSSAVYLRNINGATTTALMRPDGGCITGYEPDISYDGRRVAFWSYEDFLATHVTPWVWQIYLFDVTIGPSSLRIVSADANGVPQRLNDGIVGHGGEGSSTVAAPAISQNGRMVAFRSRGFGLWPNPPMSGGSIIGQVYVKDSYTGSIVVASVDSTGTVLGNGDSSGSGSGYRPGLSSDGQYVVFRTTATNIAPPTGSGFVLRDIYGYTTGLTTTATSSLPELSPSGRFLTIHSNSAMDPRFASGGMFLFDLGILYAPTITRLTPGGGKIRIEFTASTANATAASSYIAICQAADGSGNIATGTGSPLTVTGLTNGVSYVCTVMAVNALGLFSTASNLMSKRAGADLTPILMLLLD